MDTGAAEKVGWRAGDLRLTDERMGETLQNMELERTVGLRADGAVWLPERRAAVSSILLKLAAMGVRIPAGAGEEDVLHLAGDLFARYREQTRLLSEHLCPADQRIQRYIDGLLASAAVDGPVRLPAETLILDRYGLARELSLPIDAEAWRNELVSSYRLDNGVLHNPVNDRRTTQGVFHVAEGGLPIPADKLRVPLATYLRLLEEALRPPAELLRLPFTANWPEPVETMVSLLLRPLVCPAVPKVSPEKRMEVRFFVPGGLISNLDFVESIFGNAGDPYLPGHDAALDVDGWTGHSGCVILAPHLTRSASRTSASERERGDDAERAAGMCWAEESELYNDGRPFKLTSRASSGVMVSLKGRPSLYSSPSSAQHMPAARSASVAPLTCGRPTSCLRRRGRWGARMTQPLWPVQPSTSRAASCPGR